VGAAAAAGARAARSVRAAAPPRRAPHGLAPLRTGAAAPAPARRVLRAARPRGPPRAAKKPSPTNPNRPPRPPAAGDKMRFNRPFGNSPKERGFVVSPGTMAKFAGSGFEYIGHAALSAAPRVRKLIARAKERAAATGATDAAAAEDEAASSDSLAAVLKRAGSSQQQIKVDIVRGDRAGNMFSKS
jgi:hypothetical protein